jgi:hypothetical protein
MIYKILIIKNRFKGKLNLSKYTDIWFTKNTPIEVVSETITTDFDVTPEKVSNGTYTGVIVGADIITKLKTVVKENIYNAVIFVYGNDLGGIRVSCCNGSNRQGNLYTNTELVQICKTNDSGKTANHELFHAFYAKANRVGISITDNMDTYLNDNDLTLKKESNRTIALDRLKPYWSEICSFKQAEKPKLPSRVAILLRQKSSKEQTLGDIICVNNGDIFMCKSLELSTEPNAVGDTCIPTGVYNVVWTLSPKFKKFTYELQSMPSYRIHSGNYYTNTEGCILLGNAFADINKDGILDVVNSMVTIKQFEDFFDRKSFTLIVS